MPGMYPAGKHLVVVRVMSKFSKRLFRILEYVQLVALCGSAAFRFKLDITFTAVAESGTLNPACRKAAIDIMDNDY